MLILFEDYLYHDFSLFFIEIFQFFEINIIEKKLDPLFKRCQKKIPQVMAFTRVENGHSNI